MVALEAAMDANQAKVLEYGRLVDGFEERLDKALRRIERLEAQNDRLKRAWS
jgi:hypothetical protein